MKRELCSVSRNTTTMHFYENAFFGIHCNIINRPVFSCSCKLIVCLLLFSHDNFIPFCIHNFHSPFTEIQTAFNGTWSNRRTAKSPRQYRLHILQNCLQLILLKVGTI